MTWEEARQNFLSRKHRGEDVMIVRCGAGAMCSSDPKDVDDFDVIDRLTAIENQKKKSSN